MSIVLDGSNLTTTGVINSGTAVASTSGTSIDFTGIPAGVKRITVVLNGVSLSGTADFLFQVGAGSVTSSGYVAATIQSFSGSPYNNSASSTAGFISKVGNASAVYSGIVTIALVGSNVWVSSHVMSTTAAGPLSSQGGGTVTLSGTLDRVRITTVNGTDTFDAGSINILYE